MALQEVCVLVYGEGSQLDQLSAMFTQQRCYVVRALGLSDIHPCRSRLPFDAAFIAVSLEQDEMRKVIATVKDGKPLVRLVLVGSARPPVPAQTFQSFIELTSENLEIVALFWANCQYPSASDLDL